MDYFHLTVHLAPNSFNSFKKNKKTPISGPLHFIQNNISGIQPIPPKLNPIKPTIVISVKYDPNKNNSLVFSLGNCSFNIDNTILKESQVIIDILNNYFDKSKNNYINTYYTDKHSNINAVIKTLNNSLQKLGIQRNNKITTQKYNNINKTNKRKKNMTRKV